MATNGTKVKKQLAWVFDLNKCIGCQTCSVACKVLWNEGEEGTEYMWWMTVNTQPGQGTPKDWEKMGGGYKGGKLQKGHIPTNEEFGGGWNYNYEEVLHGGKGRSVHLQKIAGSKTWARTGTEDEGGGVWPNPTSSACASLQPLHGCFLRESVRQRPQEGPEFGLVLRDEDSAREPAVPGVVLQEGLLQQGAGRQPALHRLFP
jgi:ethylbenzene hydroxylase subunit beta/complex iron-sulfur molybdoenzyme family reductase subunit beta